MAGVGRRSIEQSLRKAAPVALIAALLTPSAIWILTDQRVWTWDSAHYGAGALDLWHAGSQGLSAWFHAMSRSLSFMPPLIAWGGHLFVPLVRLTGEIESALLFFNVVLAAGVLTLIFVVARRCGAGTIGSLAAVAACGGAPLFVGLTHLFLTEMAQCFAAALAIFAASRAERRSLLRTFALAVLATAIGFLSKASSAVFVLPMLTYIVVVLIIARRVPKPPTTARDAALLLLAIVMFSMTVLWYVSNWPSMTAHFVAATTGDTALHYGLPVDLLRGLKYWTVWLGNALSSFPAVQLGILAVVIGALATALIAVARQPPELWPETIVANGTLFALALAGTVIVTIFTYALQINMDTRFSLPLVPPVAVLLGWSFSILRSRLAASLGLVALLANAAVDHAYAHRIDPFRLSAHSYLAPADGDPRDKVLLTQAVGATCHANIADRINVVAVQYPTLNPNSANFFSRKARRLLGYACVYAHVGQTTVQDAMDRIIGLAAPYVVTVVPEKQPPPDFVNVVSRELAVQLANDPRFELAPGSGDYLLIYHRRTVQN